MRIAYIGIIFMGVTIITNRPSGAWEAREAITLSVFRHAVSFFLPLIILPRFLACGHLDVFPCGRYFRHLPHRSFVLMRLFNWLGAIQLSLATEFIFSCALFRVSGDIPVAMKETLSARLSTWSETRERCLRVRMAVQKSF